MNVPTMNEYIWQPDVVLLLRINQNLYIDDYMILKILNLWLCITLKIFKEKKSYMQEGRNKWNRNKSNILVWRKRESKAYCIICLVVYSSLEKSFESIKIYNQVIHYVREYIYHYYMP